MYTFRRSNFPEKKKKKTFSGGKNSSEEKLKVEVISFFFFSLFIFFFFILPQIAFTITPSSFFFLPSRSLPPPPLFSLTSSATLTAKSNCFNRKERVSPYDVSNTKKSPFRVSLSLSLCPSPPPPPSNPFVSAFLSLPFICTNFKGEEFFFLNTKFIFFFCRKKNRKVEVDDGRDESGGGEAGKSWLQQPTFPKPGFSPVLLKNWVLVQILLFLFFLLYFNGAAFSASVTAIIVISVQYFSLWFFNSFS